MLPNMKSNMICNDLKQYHIGVSQSVVYEQKKHVKGKKWLLTFYTTKRKSCTTIKGKSRAVFFQ